MQNLSVAQKTAQTARANQASVLPGAPQVIFTHWREALHGSGLARHLQAAHEHGMGRFLEFCTLSGRSVTRPSASNFLSDAHRRRLAPPDGQWEQGLDWFFVSGRLSAFIKADSGPSAGPGAFQAVLPGPPADRR